jgi:hypothetical protein
VRMLFIGDVVGQSEMDAIAEHLHRWIAAWQVGLTIVNGENAAGTDIGRSAGVHLRLTVEPRRRGKRPCFRYLLRSGRREDERYPGAPPLGPVLGRKLLVALDIEISAMPLPMGNREHVPEAADAVTRAPRARAALRPDDPG